MNWGHKITAAYLGFVVLMMTLVIMSIRQKDIFLVTENYYDDEINYQEKLNKIKNTRALTKPATVLVKGDSLWVDLSAVSANSVGEILLYRPSNKALDTKIDLKTDGNGQQRIYLGNLAKGLWATKINWSAMGKEYYLEEKIQF
jgi:hypothetical protein